jgi:hypothetical protein
MNVILGRMTSSDLLLMKEDGYNHEYSFYDIRFKVFYDLNFVVGTSLFAKTHSRFLKIFSRGKFFLSDFLLGSHIEYILISVSAD